jgi:hypothetical protein
VLRHRGRTTARLAPAAVATGLTRRLSNTTTTTAVTTAATRRLPAMAFAVARVTGMMFARLRGLCLPGAVRMFAGSRTVIMSARPGPRFGPRLSLAIAWRAAAPAVVVAAVAALAGLTRSMAGSSGRRRGSRDYDEARCENAGRSGNACPRSHDVTSPSRPMSTHTNPTTLKTLTLNHPNA